MKRFKVKDFTDNPPLYQFRRLLVRHSSVMESLRQEVRSVVGYVEHPTREQIRKMPYLAMVIKESTEPYSRPHQCLLILFRSPCLPTSPLEQPHSQ